jgi:hypothetical protein
VLRHHKLLRDFPTQRRHLFTSEASFATRLNFARLKLLLHLRHSYLGWFGFAAVFHGFQHIGFRQSPTLTRPGDLFQIELLFFHNPADSG